MTYDNKCYYCSNREKYIDIEIESAKKFYEKYDCDWVFGCGARYSKRFFNTHGVEIIPANNCMIENNIDEVKEIEKLLNINIEK